MGRSALSAVLGALLMLLAASFAPPGAARAEGRIGGEPPRDGMALTTWSGGPVEALADAAAEGGGCALRSVHANGPDGLVGYVFGAPEEANSAFLDRYAGGELPAATPILLVCGEPAPPPAVSFGDGEHRVGVDIAPGSYRTTTATDECVWSFGDWLPDGGAAASMAIALIGPDHATFASSRCGVWEKDPPPIAVPGQPFGDGAWFVGSEVEPGRYRAAAPADGCRWERMGAYGWPGAGGAPKSKIGIWIRLEDTAFFSRGCGVWERDPAPTLSPGQPFGDGVWFVGPEIAPGVYRTTTAADECEWDLEYGVTRLDSAGGSAASMAVAVVVDSESGVFTSRGCGEWTQDPVPLIEPGQPFGDGAWLVGPEVEPGRYRTTTAADECVWERLGDRRRVYRGWGSPAAIALIQWRDAAFFSRGCGTWERETTAVAAPMPTFGDGAWFVGSEIAPGRYRTATATDECERQRLGDRSHDGIRIARWAAVLIDPEDVAFTTSGCGTWEQEPSPVEPGQPFGDGAWFVGSEVEPGRYRTTPPTEECEWGYIGAGGYRDDSWFSSFAMAIAVIEADDAVFVSGGCGEWSRIAAPLAEQGEAIGDGAWLVGSEVAPGRYRAGEDADGCRWELAERAGASILPPGSRQPLRYGRGLTIVDIKPDDFSFSTGGCGWTTDLTPRVEPGQPFGDGTFLVGTEIAPGRYRASMVDSCYWYRWYRFDGFGGYREAGLRTIVDIAPDDAGFTSFGCGVWSNDLTPRVEPGQPFGDGTWLVGPEIEPGLYRSDGADASCRWERLSDFRHYSERYIVASAIDTGSRAFVDIAPGDAGFHTRGCGVWTPSP